MMVIALTSSGLYGECRDLLAFLGVLTRFFGTLLDCSPDSCGFWLSALELIASVVVCHTHSILNLAFLKESRGVSASTLLSQNSR